MYPDSIDNVRDEYQYLIESIQGCAAGADRLRKRIENTPPGENQPIQLATGVARVRDLLRTIVKYELHRFETWKTADHEMRKTLNSD